LPFSGGLAWLNKSRKEQNQGKSASDDVGVLLPFFVPILGVVRQLTTPFLFSSTTPSPWQACKGK